MATVGIEIKGIRRLQGIGANLPALIEAAVQAVIAKYVLLIEAEAKRLAPVDTGFLRANIRHELERLAGLVVSGADYSKFVEWGTRFASAQPFLFPAFEQYRQAFIDEVRQAIRDAIKQAAAGAPR